MLDWNEYHKEKELNISPADGDPWIVRSGTTVGC